MLKQKPVGKIFRFSAYDLLFPLGINRLTQLIVCKVYKANNCLQMF